MAFYNSHILPHLIAMAMKRKALAAYRARIVSAARGRILDLGIGSGLNLPFYAPGVEEIIGIDPSPKLLEMARRKGNASGRNDLRLIEGSAEAIPLETGSVDTAVLTWTLCSIPSAPKALSEIRRVLRPGGELLFVEHGLSPERNVAIWQHRLTPVWKRLAGGCHLDRDVRELLRTSGFAIRQMHQGYIRGPGILTFMSEGRARPI